MEITGARAFFAYDTFITGFLANFPYLLMRMAKAYGALKILGSNAGSSMTILFASCSQLSFSCVVKRSIVVPAASVTSFKTNFLSAGYFGKMAYKLFAVSL